MSGPLELVGGPHDGEQLDSSEPWPEFIEVGGGYRHVMGTRFYRWAPNS